MSDDWDFYFSNVNNELASIFVDLGIRKFVPDKSKPNLLSVLVDLRWPSGDGLSSPMEFESLKAIEDTLNAIMLMTFDAVAIGRITTDGRREFYYYAPHLERLEPAVEDAMSQFPDYDFDCGTKPDPEWRHYLDVLYPSDEDSQRIKNRKVIELLEEKNDTLKTPRDVSHWIYFRTEIDREDFRHAVELLEYRFSYESQSDQSDFSFGLCVVRFQSVNPIEIDNAVDELLRLAKLHNGDYDGWETQVIPP